MAGVTSAAARDAAFMARALDAARRAGLAGQPPVGACIVRNGEVLATAANAVIAETDPTAHAEVAAIRAACRASRRVDLDDCEIFSTVQPCPMCLAACHYAGIRRLVYGASLADMQAVTHRELTTVSDPATIAPHIAISGGCLREESLALLRQWAAGSVR
jgi:tRNA(adenine34) deaminase